MLLQMVFSFFVGPSSIPLYICTTDGWMASVTWRTWVWASSGHWWWTGKPGVPQSLGSQRVGHDWSTELNWTIVNMYKRMWYIYTMQYYSAIVSFKSWDNYGDCVLSSFPLLVLNPLVPFSSLFYALGELPGWIFLILTPSDFRLILTMVSRTRNIERKRRVGLGLYSFESFLARSTQARYVLWTKVVLTFCKWIPITAPLIIPLYVNAPQLCY